MPSYGSNDGYGRQQFGDRPSTRLTDVGRKQNDSSAMASLLAEEDLEPMRAAPSAAALQPMRTAPPPAAAPAASTPANFTPTPPTQRPMSGGGRPAGSGAVAPVGGGAAKEELQCVACGGRLGREYVSALGHTWHESCFVCAVCHTPFGDAKFVAKDGRPYHDSCFLE
eukprot:316654-Prymnesium_polylepis.1